MMLFLVAVLLALLAFGITRRSRRYHRQANPALTAAAYFLPAAMLALTLGWAALKEDGFLRFALLGFGFPAEDTGRTIGIGGARDHHELWVRAFDDGGGEGRKGAADEERARRLTLGELRLTPPTQPGSEGFLQLAAPQGSRAGLLGLVPEGRLRPWPAIELEEGDEVRVGATSWKLAAGSLFGALARFEGGGTAGGTVVELPRRRGALPIVGISYPILRAAAVQQATYPLAWLDRAAGGFAEPRPEGIFFYEPTFWGGKLFLSSRDPAVKVLRGGQEVSAPFEQAVGSGARLHLLSPPRWDGQGFEAGGVRDRRSFRLLEGERGLGVFYDRPEIYVLRWSSLQGLDLQTAEQQKESDVLRVPLAMGGWQLADKSLYFEHAGTKVALEALTVLELPRSPGLLRDLRSFRFKATTPAGEREAGLGEVLWLGSRNQAAVQLDFVSPPWILGVFALVLAFLKARAARNARLSTALALLAGALEVLLALRLLLGWQTWALPPFREETYSLALLAFMILPWVLLLAAQPPWRPEDRSDKDDLRRRLPLLAGLVLALFFPLALAGFGLAALAWMLLVLAAAALPILRGRGLFDRLAERLDGSFDRLFPPARELWVWAALGFFPGLLRLLLLALGFRESVQAGERFALTLLHIPLVLAIEALYLVWMWRRAEEKGALTRRELWPALMILAGSWALPAFMVSDLGLALLNAPVFLLVLGIATLALGRELGRRGGLYRAPWLVFALAMLVLMLPLGARLLIRATDLAPEALSQRLLSERNYLRLLDFAYPQRLEQVARTTSEELMVMGEVLRSYTQSGLFGRGWLNTEISPHIEGTALREHVPAIFVASQWGLLGGIGLALVFVLIGTSAAMAAPGSLERPPGGGLREATVFPGLAALAAATLALPSLHMLLANYRLAIFTGKNAYLLGLDSTADVLEAGLLVLLAACGAATARDDQEPI
jgi:hypothetical protein